MVIGNRQLVIWYFDRIDSLKVLDKMESMDRLEVLNLSGVLTDCLERLKCLSTQACGKKLED